ncbi:Heat stress transcription factor A-4b [Platanthera guangdongensis]|uniref:Heat stress transcription factor A-4b n=1 Tax=Platanthera guangdongensis TaxID=2320717 RepID=A0ABR2N3A2_9ASPA
MAYPASGSIFLSCDALPNPTILGFRKIDPERWEFANDEFIRGQKHLLKNIHRRKPIHSHSIPPPGSILPAQLSYPERQELMEEIERLKLEKNSLIIELEKHAQHQLAMDQHMQDLEDRLHGMALRQRNLISFLDQAIQRPGFLSSLIQHSDLQAKKRRLPTDDDCPLRDAAMQERFGVTVESGSTKEGVLVVRFFGGGGCWRAARRREKRLKQGAHDSNRRMLQGKLEVGGSAGGFNCLETLG